MAPFWNPFPGTFMMISRSIFFFRLLRLILTNKVPYFSCIIHQFIAQSGPPGNNTFRYDGLILAVEVEYSNWRAFDYKDKPSYTYRAILFPKTKYLIKQPVYTNYPTDRLLLERNGIEIIFITSGELRQFSAIQFFVSIGTILSY